MAIATLGGIGVIAVMALFAINRDVPDSQVSAVTSTVPDALSIHQQPRTLDDEPRPASNVVPETIRNNVNMSDSAQPEVSPDSLLASQKRNVVWVGYMLRDFVFPYGTGCLVRRDCVATSAVAASDLELLANDGIQPVVGMDGRLLRASTIRLHPQFDAGNPGAAQSRHSNVGLLQLETAADTSCVLASEEHMRALTSARQLYPIGFDSDLGDHEPFDDLKFRQRCVPATLLASDLLATASTRVYSLSAPVAKCWEGAPVFNDQGRLVGIQSTTTGKSQMVPVTQLTVLLDKLEMP